MARPPASARAAAASLRKEAADITDAAYRVSTAVEGMDFAGPAAVRLRGRIRVHRRKVNAIAQDLAAIADSILRGSPHP